MPNTLVPDDERVVAADRIPGLVVADFLRFACEESMAFADEGSPFTARMDNGDPRLTVVVGANASGKSLLHRVVAGLAHGHGIEPISLSIRERTGSNESPGSMRRQWMYGAEHMDSTGNTSLRTTRKAFETMSSRTSAAMLLLDEPEIGLSEGFAHAFGELIGRLASIPPDKGCGVMVVSHSRSLVRGLEVGLGARPGYVVTGEGPDTLAEWLDTVEMRTVEDLEALATVASERRAAARTFLGI